MIKYIIRNHTKNFNLKPIRALGKRNFGKSITKLTTKKIGDVFSSRRRGFAVGDYSIKRIMLNGKILKHTRCKKKAVINLFKLRMCLKGFGE